MQLEEQERKKQEVLKLRRGYKTRLQIPGSNKTTRFLVASTYLKHMSEEEKTPPSVISKFQNQKHSNHHLQIYQLYHSHVIPVLSPVLGVDLC